MAYPVRDGKGVTYIKDADSVWKPIRGLWQKTGVSTWTPVVRANLKVNSTNWESVYPAPQAYLTPSPGSLTFTPFQYHTEPDNDLDGNVSGAAVSVTLQNTGDDDLRVQSVTVNAAPAVTFELVDSTCSGNAAISLVATPNGGTFSGAGVFGSSFDPALASIGSNTVTYAVTIAGETCQGVATR